ncbi:MAG: hypothetical protein K9L85_02830 [Candidatus Peribacteraceae bacterium]|nr:hypothetical protein [Candidatus Peribacteraceae bacterium]
MILALVAIAGIIAPIIAGFLFDFLLRDYISSDIILITVAIIAQSLAVWLGVIFVAKIYDVDDREAVLKKSLIYLLIWLIFIILLSPQENFYHGYGYPNISFFAGLLRDFCNLMLRLQQLGLPLGFRSRVSWWQANPAFLCLEVPTSSSFQ